MRTPGPWIVDGKRIRTQAIVFPGAERGATVAQVDKGAVGSEQARGNAALIQAAPELLAVLRDIKTYCDGINAGAPQHGALLYELYQRMSAAIALADPKEA